MAIDTAGPHSNADAAKSQCLERKPGNANPITRMILCGSAFCREKLRYAYFQRIPAGVVYYAQAQLELGLQSRATSSSG
jgi:hypothetical protein